MSFGNRLREERKRIGLSQIELAERLAMHRQTQRLYETGKNSPDTNYLQSVMALGMDVQYLLTGTRSLTPAEGITEDEAMLLDYYRASPPEGKVSLRAAGAALAQSLKKTG